MSCRGPSTKRFHHFLSSGDFLVLNREFTRPASISGIKLISFIDERNLKGGEFIDNQSFFLFVSHSLKARDYILILIGGETEVDKDILFFFLQGDDKLFFSTIWTRERSKSFWSFDLSVIKTEVKNRKRIAFQETRRREEITFS